jgi:5-oxoprolinase (ATP-hydrolysing) subunit A
MTVRVDLNADLGEGFGVWTLGDDTGLLDVITSANVACGFHAGDPITMRRVCADAVDRQVRIGAQVGYRDLAGFGRRAMDVASPDLQADIVYQIGALDAFARLAGDRVRYVKPHGALYNTAAVDERQADAVAAAVAAYSSAHSSACSAAGPVGLALLGLPGSALERGAAAHGVTFVGEAFADRAYLPSGQLVPRSEPGALITDPGAVVEHALELVANGTIRSICLHGDTPGAAELARRVRAALQDAGVDVGSFS